MRISTNPPQHLSNYEVLQHFLGLKQDNDALRFAIDSQKIRTRQNAKQRYPLKVDKEREEETEHLPTISAADDEKEKTAERRGISDDLVWVQDQVIKYLCADYNLTTRQTSDGVSKLATDLQRHGLVKAEVLQICNLAPTQPVELYVIIEEPDSRFRPDTSDKLAEIASDVRQTLLVEAPADLQQYMTALETEPIHPTGGQDDDMRMRDEMMAEEEFLHEAMWGANKEEGVGDEVDEDPME